jgi:uncharacterized protein (TIGR02231 family)
MQKNIITAFLFSLLTLCDSAVSLDATSAVGKVTVFQDRALVERVAQVALPAGASVIVLSDIPDRIDRETLKVSGSGTAQFTIGGIEYKSLPVPDSSSERVKAIISQIEKLEAEQETLKKKLNILNVQRKLIKDVKLDAVDATGAGKPRNAVEMKDILAFVGSSLSTLNQESVGAEERVKVLDKEIELLRRELDNLNPQNSSKVRVEVAVDAKSAGQAELILSYQINGARWSPTYTLYSTSAGDSSSVVLDSYALLSQQTGEDWSNVTVQLSTARPGMGLNRPEPFGLNLNIYEIQARTLSKSFGKSMSAPMMMDLAGGPAPEAAMMPAAEAGASIDNSYGAISFNLPKKISIKSDGSEQKVKLTSTSFTAGVTTVGVPFLASEVYDEIKFAVPDAPLLPGTVRVINNGTFVGAKEIPFTAKGGDVILPIGVSAEIEVKRTQLKKFEDDPGIVRSFKRITVQYEIEVKNLVDKPKSVAVLERGVVSQNEKIKVSLADVSPAALAEADPARISVTPGVWEWSLKLNPKETKKINYAVTVEIPAGVNVPGLESL